MIEYAKQLIELKKLTLKMYLSLDRNSEHYAAQKFIYTRAIEQAESALDSGIKCIKKEMFNLRGLLEG